MTDTLLIGEKLVSVFQVAPEGGHWPSLVLQTEVGFYQICENGVERVCISSGEPVEIPRGCVGDAAVKEVRYEDSDICVLLDPGWIVHYFLNFDPATNTVWPRLAFDSPEEAHSWEFEFEKMAKFV